MKSFFSPEFFEANRKSLLEAYKDKLPLVISGNGLLQRGADTTYAFFQDASFWYLAGLDEPDLILVIDKDESYIISPSRSAARDAFDGKVDNKYLKARSGVNAIYSDKPGWEKLIKRLKQSKQVTTILPPPVYIDHFGFYTNPARSKLHAGLSHLVPKVHDAAPTLLTLRTIKQAPEIKAIQAAIDITGETMSEVLSKKRLTGYNYEYEIEAHISAGFRFRGAAGDGFEPIVAVGKNAATLHHFSDTDKINKQDLLLVDIGAEVEHYSADITRVYSLSEPSTRQRELFAAVKDVQAYAISLLKPGVMLAAYEAEVVSYLGKQLKLLGIIKTIDKKTMRRVYPQRTSHFLGLNVHDSGEYNKPLAAGAVLTVEPGIYVPKEGIGIRLEDDILITEEGVKNLSSKIPINL